MSLASMRKELTRLRQSMPAVTSSDSATKRFADLLASIEAEPAGPRRNFVIAFAVSVSRHEEPGDFAQLLEAIGPERLAEAYPDGDVPKVYGDPCVRARARAYVPTPGTIDPISELIAAQIKKRAEAAQ
jgi:hypothetical protein